MRGTIFGVPRIRILTVWGHSIPRNPKLHTSWPGEDSPASGAPKADGASGTGRVFWGLGLRASSFGVQGYGFRVQQLK